MSRGWKERFRISFFGGEAKKMAGVKGFGLTKIGPTRRLRHRFEKFVSKMRRWESGKIVVDWGRRLGT